MGMAVKAIVWAAMAIVFFGGLFMGLQVMNRDPGLLIGVAVGKVDANNECQLQVTTPIMGVGFDAPTKFNANDNPDYNHWLNTHYILKDATGNVTKFKKGGFKSADISENQAGTSEFIGLAQLEKGKTYTLEIVPSVHAPEKYIRTIEATPTDFMRITFEPNY